MKKIIALALASLSIVSVMAACGKKGETKTGTCDLCGTENVEVASITVDGDTAWFCDNCYDTAEQLAKLAEEMM